MNFDWTYKQDGVDFILAEDVNKLARGINKSLEKAEEALNQAKAYTDEKIRRETSVRVDFVGEFDGKVLPNAVGGFTKIIFNGNNYETTNVEGHIVLTLLNSNGELASFRVPAGFTGNDTIIFDPSAWAVTWNSETLGVSDLTEQGNAFLTAMAQATILSIYDFNAYYLYADVSYYADLETAVKKYVDEKDTQTLTNAKAYADGKAADVLSEAKTYADGKDTQTLTNAKAYVDEQVVQLKGDLVNKIDKPHHYEVVTFTEESGYFKDGSITESSDWKHIEISVSAGETYIIDGVGNGYVHAYNFCKSDKSVISTSTESGTVTFIDEIITIPNECEYLIINYHHGILATVNIKKKVIDNIDVSEEFSLLSESIEELKQTKAEKPTRIEPVAFTENTGYYREDGINGNTSWRYAKIPIEAGTYIVDCFGNKYVRGWYLLDTDSNIIAKADETETSNIYTNEIVVATSDGFLVLNRNQTISALKCHRKKIIEVGANKLYGKRIACFGDSIFGNAREDGITDIIANLTGATVYNCAFGGARMSVHLTDNWTKCSMFNIADCIASGDYSSIYNAVHDSSWTTMPYYFVDTEALIESIDFSKVDIATISYGTNDFTGSVVLDNDSNKYDTSTICGALRHSVETLLTAYSNINIFILLPCYRWWFDESLIFTDDSDTHVNENGKTLIDYCNALKGVANEYHIAVIDNYNVGINKFNRERYIPKNDGVHHNVAGRDLIARHIINELY